MRNTKTNETMTNLTITLRTGLDAFQTTSFEIVGAPVKYNNGVTGMDLKGPKGGQKFYTEKDGFFTIGNLNRSNQKLTGTIGNGYGEYKINF